MTLFKVELESTLPDATYPDGIADCFGSRAGSLVYKSTKSVPRGDSIRSVDTGIGRCIQYSIKDELQVPVLSLENPSNSNLLARSQTIVIPAFVVLTLFLLQFCFVGQGF